MANINDWNKYINVVHELALVEDALRDDVSTGNQRVSTFAAYLLTTPPFTSAEWVIANG